MKNQHIELHRKAFPTTRLTIFQQEMIEMEVTDAEAWKETIYFWGGNNYRGESVFRMIEYYKEVIQKRPANRVQVGVDRSEEEHYDCPACFDLKLKLFPKEGGKPWEMEERPCPRCAKEAMAI